MNRRTWMCILPVLAAGVVGCQNKVHDENVALRRQNVELQDRLRMQEVELASRPQPSDVAALQGQLAERDRAIEDLRAQLLAKPAPGEAEPDPALSGLTVTRDDRTGTITVAVPGAVLFAPGDADVKASAGTTLKKLAAVVKKDYPGKKVIVAGHTDSSPISRTKDKWKDNLDLSAARARSVANFLIKEGGLDPKNVGLQALSDTQPKKTPDQSRRVEIVVVTR